MMDCRKKQSLKRRLRRQSQEIEQFVLDTQVLARLKTHPLLGSPSFSDALFFSLIPTPRTAFHNGGVALNALLKALLSGETRLRQVYMPVVVRKNLF